MTKTFPPEFAARLVQMKTDGVLIDVASHKLDASQGVIVCACGDGDQERNYTDYLSNVLHRRMHRLQLNGGPLSLAPESPLYFTRDDDGLEFPVGVVLRNQARDSVRLKGIPTVAFVAHIPCGAAALGNMTVDQIVHCLIAGKRAFAGRYRDSDGVRVACFIHIDWTSIAPDLGKGAKTYFVPADAAEAWLANPPPLPQLREPLADHATHADA